VDQQQQAHRSSQQQEQQQQLQVLPHASVTATSSAAAAAAAAAAAEKRSTMLQQLQELMGCSGLGSEPGQGALSPAAAAADGTVLQVYGLEDAATAAPAVSDELLGSGCVLVLGDSQPSGQLQVQDDSQHEEGCDGNSAGAANAAAGGSAAAGTSAEAATAAAEGAEGAPGSPSFEFGIWRAPRECKLMACSWLMQQSRRETAREA
jgi:hypothetical protein